MARRKKNDPALNFTVGTILVILLMPIVGLVLTFNQNLKKQILGMVLLVVGILLWLFFFL